MKCLVFVILLCIAIAFAAPHQNEDEFIYSYIENQPIGFQYVDFDYGLNRLTDFSAKLDKKFITKKLLGLGRKLGEEIRKIYDEKKEADSLDKKGADSSDPHEQMDSKTDNKTDIKANSTANDKTGSKIAIVFGASDESDEPESIEVNLKEAGTIDPDTLDFDSLDLKTFDWSTVDVSKLSYSEIYELFMAYRRADGDKEKLMKEPAVQDFLEKRAERLRNKIDDSPHKRPTVSPNQRPTASPHKRPTVSPHNRPSVSPHNRPSVSPHNRPSVSPHNRPSVSPHNRPTVSPHNRPTVSPHNRPSVSPNNRPTVSPNKRPTVSSKSSGGTSKHVDSSDKTDDPSGSLDNNFDDTHIPDVKTSPQPGARTTFRGLVYDDIIRFDEKVNEVIMRLTDNGLNPDGPDYVYCCGLKNAGVGDPFGSLEWE